jgi:2-oxo-3-hexenedioate decarboxylase
METVRRQNQWGGEHLLRDALTDELISLHESPREVPPFSDRFAGLTPDDGYAAARALHAHRVVAGWHPVGRKIGFTNRTLWPRYGVDAPIWGTVYDRTLLHARDDHATVPLAGLVNPRIEPEICFRLSSPPPESSDPEQLLAAIDWVAHAVEIVQSHHPGWRFRLPDCTADNGLHGRLVTGTPVPTAQVPHLVERLVDVQVILRKGDAEIDRGIGANVLGSPLLALAHLVTALAGQPEAPPLAAGEIVTTGVLTDAHPVAAGETWSTEVRGLPLPGLRIIFA